MVHASLRPYSGFRGRPAEMIAALKDAVGPEGLLAMPSMTYTDSSEAFLKRGAALDVKRSPSKMGLLSEIFRRGKGVLRSRHPTHPILAWGQRAEWFVEAHEEQPVPFGPGTPFAKLLDLNGKVLCIDASFASITFTHFLEDRIHASIPFDFYEPEPMVGRVIDEHGTHMEVLVRVISNTARRKRREKHLINTLIREGRMRRARIGNTRLLLLECHSMVDCVDDMRARGESFFDVAG